ncbi:MAG TPA: hypothetical protein VJ808_02610, partial [Gemmatimonadales bacterium]|nr:hypothetical protein [Gemmatimonadales bacterium]
MSPAGRLHLGQLILWAAPLLVLACGGEGGTDVILPTLRITTATSGVELDPDGYTVSIDGQTARSTGTNSTLTAEELAEGQHTVELLGIAGNCTVAGENPRAVSVTAGETATLAFVITCSPSMGSVMVATTTSGVAIDADGYALSLDGTDRGPIGVSATSSVADVVPGSHTIGLTGIAANCQISGENPRAVEVAAGETAQVAFALTCTELGPTTGGIEVGTATTGAGTDPDGFALLLDGASRGPIGLNGTSSIAGLVPGSHTIGLTEIAGNCQVAGDNPRAVTVPAGGTAQVAFAVTCTATGPTTGTLVIATATTGAAQDADGYLISIDGGTGQPIGINASSRVTNVSAAQHTVELLGLAANCSVAGANPRGVAVEPGETAQISFVVTCVAIVGSLRVTIEGLPGGVPAAVTVSGPNNYSQQVTATRTLNDLTPGSYAVSAAGVTSGGNTYSSSVSRPTVPVVAGATATVTVSYTAVVVNPTLNLRIDGLYLTQSTQTYAGNVPLVADRAGYLRVFVVANEANSATPSVRVTLSRPGAAAQTLVIPAPGGQTPLQVQEGALGSSWNIQIPASMIRPGLTVMAELDPGNDIRESNENDNRFPASGGKPLIVRAVPAASILFVPVQYGSDAPGNVTSANKDQLIASARRMYPLNSIATRVRSVYSATGEPLQFNGGGWDQLVSELEALRVDEGSADTYFGVVKLDYTGGKDGNAFQGELRADGPRAAAGTDAQTSVARVLAHELGHTWGQLHTPCGAPPAIDGGYPYGSGIGVYGFDVTAGTLKTPSSPDIMGYCLNPWISDYTYNRIMNFR